MSLWRRAKQVKYQRESQLQSLQWRKCRCWNGCLGTLALGTLFSAFQSCSGLSAKETSRQNHLPGKQKSKCPSLMFLVRQREHGEVPWLSCNRTNTAHAHLNTSVLAESSAQAHELQEESKQDAACHKGDKLFFPPVTTAASFHSQTVRACHGEPGGSKICHSLISRYHFHPREPFFLLPFFPICPKSKLVHILINP